jgi:hypothetical protein
VLDVPIVLTAFAFSGAVGVMLRLLSREESRASLEPIDALRTT